MLVMFKCMYTIIFSVHSRFEDPQSRATPLALVAQWDVMHQSGLLEMLADCINRTLYCILPYHLVTWSVQSSWKLLWMIVRFYILAKKPKPPALKKRVWADDPGAMCIWKLMFMEPTSLSCNKAALSRRIAIRCNCTTEPYGAGRHVLHRTLVNPRAKWDHSDDKQVSSNLITAESRHRELRHSVLATRDTDRHYDCATPTSHSQMPWPVLSNTIMKYKASKRVDQKCLS